MVDVTMRLLNAFPSELEQEVKEVCNILSLQNHTIKANNVIRFTLQEQTLCMPYRIYFDEPDQVLEKGLTLREQSILHCIFLRHHNGYIREKRLKALMHIDEYWIIPFTIQCLGEYVYEILEIFDGHIDEKNLKSYQLFMVENPKYWIKIKSRMVSYWHAYYRKSFPYFEKYLGNILIQRIEGLVNKDFKFYKAKKMPQIRKADYCLGCLNSSVFIDFNCSNDKTISLVRISFDGYGCCTLPEDSVCLNEQDSDKFIHEMQKDTLSQGNIKILVQEIMRLNKKDIWNDALETYGFI